MGLVNSQSWVSCFDGDSGKNARREEKSQIKEVEREKGRKAKKLTVQNNLVLFIVTVPNGHGCCPGPLNLFPAYIVNCYWT